MTKKLVVHAGQGASKISKHIYGHFAEHLGRCIYDGLWVGPESPIPNLRGVRTDIVEALRAIRIPVLRWPGGCFADEYHWQDGIGPRESRPGRVNTHWGGVIENNRFGTHEFLDLCDQLGCEPYICGNLGSGTVREMQEWVEYLTLGGKSPMAEMRRANGREAPWRVRFWGVGNENWGCGGNMRAEFYADQFRRYATYCRNYGGNKLYKIACGAADFDFRWTEVLMREAAKFMDGLSLHYYVLPGNWESKGSATQFGESEWFTVMKKTILLDGMIANHSDIMDRFDPEKRVGLIVDEWGAWYDVEPGTNPGFLYQQSTLRDAMLAGTALNIFNNHCDRVQMANLAQTVNVLQALILTEGEKMILTPTYHVFEMYKDHQDAVRLPFDLEESLYASGDESIPAVNVSASRAGVGTVLLTLCHLDPVQGLELECELRGMTPVSVTGRILTADAVHAGNTFEKPEAVQPAAFDGAKIRGGSIRISLPPKAVVSLEVM
ncbi:MAG: alpha-N-arabinofuranosidase [Anaerolineales bacterium]|nr:alpha-N-arabinofuranosidase [Anaerolineales bacterium]